MIKDHGRSVVSRYRIKARVRSEKEGKMKKILAALALGCTAMVFVACQDNTCEVTFTVDGVQYGKTLEVKKGESVSLPAAPSWS